ncbi:Tn3 family transposase [Nonomuraea sp. NPDC050680]|uniref:Tn3 family transposase n=1 Tax=Nonomuraea sp. NPDC050680 TaxID=3154630 RepID=UPI0034077B6A
MSTKQGEAPDELATMLPFTPIASLVIELDARTGFLDCFTHAGGRKLAKSAETKCNILAVLIAMATNLGLARMSEAERFGTESGVSGVLPGQWTPAVAVFRT